MLLEESRGSEDGPAPAEDVSLEELRYRWMLYKSKLKDLGNIRARTKVRGASLTGAVHRHHHYKASTLPISNLMQIIQSGVKGNGCREREHGAQRVEKPDCVQWDELSCSLLLFTTGWQSNTF